MGIQLLPFSLGHYLILTFTESPFVGDGEISDGDFLFAVHVCSKTYREALDWLLYQDYATDIAADFVRRGVRNDEFSAAIEVFREYLGEALTPPEYVATTDGDPTRAGAPWVQSMKIALIKNLHMTEEQVMDQWLLKSQFDWFSILEQNDPKKFRLKNEADYSADEMPQLTREQMMDCISRKMAVNEYAEKLKNGEITLGDGN